MYNSNDWIVTDVQRVTLRTFILRNRRNTTRHLLTQNTQHSYQLTSVQCIVIGIEQLYTFVSVSYNHMSKICYFTQCVSIQNLPDSEHSFSH